MTNSQSVGCEGSHVFGAQTPVSKGCIALVEEKKDQQPICWLQRQACLMRSGPGEQRQRVANPEELGQTVHPGAGRQCRTRAVFGTSATLAFASGPDSPASR